MCKCPCYDSINPTNSCTAFACLLLNIFLPGVGTMVNSCCGVKCFSGILVGILQILTIPLCCSGGSGPFAMALKSIADLVSMAIIIINITNIERAECCFPSG